MILSAKEARNRAGLNTPTAKLVEKIMKDISKTCDEGKLYLNFWIEDENDYTVRHASNALRRLGYTVIPGDEGEPLWIGW
jgi:hypothetical protein